jgi:hypothetical protein
MTEIRNVRLFLGTVANNKKPQNKGNYFLKQFPIRGSEEYGVHVATPINLVMYHV